MSNSTFQIGEKVITPSGKVVTIESIRDGLYRLSNGLHAYQFELRKENSN